MAHAVEPEPFACAGQAQKKFSKKCAISFACSITSFGPTTGSDTGWTGPGRFNATPGNATVPLANGQPGEWEFQVGAAKRDVEVGQPSPTKSVMIRWSD